MTATLNPRHVGYYGQLPDPLPVKPILYAILLAHPTEIGGEMRVLGRGSDDRLAAVERWDKAKAFLGIEEAKEGAAKWRGHYKWDSATDEKIPNYFPVIVPWNGPVMLATQESTS